MGSEKHYYGKEPSIAMDLKALSKALPPSPDPVTGDTQAGSQATTAAKPTENAGLSDTNSTATGKVQADEKGKDTYR